MAPFQPTDPLYHLAIVIVAGIVGGELLALARLPRVTGWIATGILLRGTADWHGQVTGLSAETTLQMRPLMNFVLGYIAFTVGAALHFAGLRNAGRRVGLLLVGEAIVTPLVVLALLWSVGRWLAPEGLSLQAAVLLAAIAIAGAPGTTVLVIQEARARGILTRTLLGSIALIDMVAVGLFVFSANYLAAIADGGQTWQEASPAALATVGREFATALAVAAAAAAVALGLIRTIISPAFLGPTMVAVILGTWGGATGLAASGILACTLAGILVSNLRHDAVSSTQAYLHAIGGILFTAFYTLAGMNIDLGLVVKVAGLVMVFVVARFIGKYAGGYAAMSLAGAPRRVRTALGLSLIPHGGVAVGLLLMVQTDPALADVAETVTAVGLAAITINQLVGPSVLRHALARAREVGKGAPRLLDFLDESHILVGLTGGTKEEVIQALVSRLYAAPRPPKISRGEFLEKVFEREAVASTVLGEGLMIPHAMLDEGQTITGVLGISSAGIDLDAPDDRPVHAVLLLATPQADRKRHLEVLAAFARAITRDTNLREQLYHARSAAHAYDVLHAEDAEEINYFLDEAISRAD